MRSITIFVFAAASALAFHAQAASFSLVSGTIHAQATARSAGPGATVNDNPADINLAGATTSGLLNAVAQTTTGFGDAEGDFSSRASVLSNQVAIGMGGSAQGDGGLPSLHGSSGGSGSLDVLFTLDEPTAVRVIQIGPFNPPNNFHASRTLLRNGVAFGLPAGSLIDTYQVLDAGNYELTATGSVGPSAGTAGNGSMSFSLTIPEPAVVGSLLIISTIARRRRN